MVISLGKYCQCNVLALYIVQANNTCTFALTEQRSCKRDSDGYLQLTEYAYASKQVSNLYFTNDKRTCITSTQYALDEPTDQHDNERQTSLSFYLHPVSFQFSVLSLLTPSMPAAPNCCCLKGPAPYWSNPLFLIFDIRVLWRSVLSARAPECQKLKLVGQTSMAKCKALTGSVVKGLSAEHGHVSVPQ